RAPTSLRYAWPPRTPAPLDPRLGPDLAAHRPDRGGVGPDEAQPRSRAGTREPRVLREEPVPRVDGLCAAVQGGLHDIGHRQITLAGGGRAESYRDVGPSDMSRRGVGVAVARDRW